MTKLTFVVPFDFTDQGAKGRKSDQTRWEDAIDRWKREIPRADHVAFEIIRGGDVMNELARDVHAGRRAFWFNEFEIGTAWLNRRWKESRDIVGERYTPEAHSPVAIEGDLDGVGLTNGFLRRLDDRLNALLRVLGHSHPWDVIELRAGTVGAALVAARQQIASEHPRFDPSQLLSALQNLLTSVDDQLETVPDLPTIERRTHQAALNAGHHLADFLDSTAVKAATTRSVGLIGPAGQGKTHTILERARALLNDDVPALVLLGQRFMAAPWWTNVSGQLGGLTVSAETFFGAFSAMCQSREQRGVIFVDALNESQDPRTWSTELRSLLNHVEAFPFVAVVVSWRSDYTDIVAPPPALIRSQHRGLAGLEAGALARYCEYFNIEASSASLFAPEFANPLFLRMFCEVRSNDPTAGVGATGRTQIFAEFAIVRGRRVEESLHLNPAARHVHRALGVVADLLIESGGQPVPRSRAEMAVDALLPSHTQWPDTLFGAMRSIGLLETVPTWRAEETESVSFPFQAFSEHLVMTRMLDQQGGGDLSSGELRQRLFDRPALWRSAAVVVPERFSLELVDVLDGVDSRRLQQATLTSLAERDPAAFGPRAMQLLSDGLWSSGRPADYLDVVLTLAPRTDHPANSTWLHESLLALTLPDRDASWGRLTYIVNERSAAFSRLVAWAVSGDTRSSDEQVMLATIPLVWTLVSPNRRLRDQTTKVLVDLFRARLPALAMVLPRFEAVDDPYVLERLAAVAYGALMRGGDSDSAGAELVAREVLRWFDDDILPINVLARDSAHGAIAWAASRRIVTGAEAARARPPYRSSPPTEPPTADELEAEHGMTKSEPRQFRAVDILHSCLDWMGDFNKYVIKGDVDTFTWYPLTEPPPESLPSDDPKKEVDGDWAGRWIANRAIELGWTPERFEQFERFEIPTSGREEHKPERFGKKYQWIALHELLGRLADNFHPTDWNDSPTVYTGPWPWFGRDIDPSLAMIEAVDGELISPVGLADPNEHWTPPAPRMQTTESAASWSSDVEDFPPLPSLTRSPGFDDGDWITLFRFSKWKHSTGAPARWGWEREQWLLQFSWLLHPGDGDKLLETLSRVGLFGRWMPDRHRAHRAYLGEGPWSPIDQAEPAEWEEARESYRHPEVVMVLPATETYLWEGNTLDCSIDETVSFDVPIGELLGDARWEGTHPNWLDGTTRVATSVRAPDGTDQHQALLIRRSWLTARLEDMNLELVVGVQGERQVMSDDGETIESWTELSSAGLYVPGNDWTFSNVLSRSRLPGAQ